MAREPSEASETPGPGGLAVVHENVVRSVGTVADQIAGSRSGRHVRAIGGKGGLERLPIRLRSMGWEGDYAGDARQPGPDHQWQVVGASLPGLRRRQFLPGESE